MVGTPGAADQLVGTGNGAQTDFPLVKHYGEAGSPQVRRITRPRPDTVLVSLNGVIDVGGWTLGDLGTIRFDTPPATGTAIRAGFHFDVPVRFGDDRLEIAGAAFAAGEAPSVPVIEIREVS